MDNNSTSLFDVYLRLRPSLTGATHRFIDIEREEYDIFPKYITIKPLANDFRKRAVERFAFTRVFEEQAQQLDIFQGTGLLPMLEGVLGSNGKSRDGLLATLGVTGSGKSHTILGSKSQRGLTQMAIHSIFNSMANNVVHPTCANSVLQSVAISDVAESQLYPAHLFLDSNHESTSTRGSCSRAQTPMIDASLLSNIGVKHKIPPISVLPKIPNMEEVKINTDPAYEFVVVISMYEVYNDRIFDLLSGQVTNQKGNNAKRRALLFKNTENSPDRKVVAGLRKIMCCTLEEALMVLEIGLLERKVAGTGSNAVSSRSHGFFCLEVKKRHRVKKDVWDSKTLTIVDLAGSERARNAKTAGTTLAEAGKINESLMYLGQCMQMQSENADGHKAIVPFRQCKLTEILFSNSFPTTHTNPHRSSIPQKAIMIVTADPTGDFNATSQILRYSALAREITVPRIPSVTSQILQANGIRPGSSSSNDSGMAHANLEQLDELARVTDELAVLAIQLEEERRRREYAELSWATNEERIADLESEIREECWAEMEDMMETERHRWRAIWEAEAERDEERIDAKIEILARNLDDHQEISQPNNTEESLIGENERLREEISRLMARNDTLEREKLLKTPTTGRKQRVLKSRKWEAEEDLEIEG